MTNLKKNKFAKVFAIAMIIVMLVSAIAATTVGCSKKLTVNFIVDDTVVATVKNGNLPTAPTKIGYTFGGWFFDKECTEAFTFDSAKSKKSKKPINAYAKWNVVTNTITYNLGGGTNHADNPTEFSIASDTITLQAPTKTSYDFLGWYGNAEFTGDAITKIAKGSTANVTLFASWEIVTYDIAYNLDGGTNHADNPNNYTMESETITLQAPTKTGYTFLGWYGNAEFTDAAITEIVKVGTADIALFASWEINEYTLTFVTNGGGDVEPITQNFNTAITLPTLTKTGHTFAGWYTDEGLTTAFTSTTMPAESMTLYAKWDAVKYAITYNLDGGANHADNPDNYTMESETITLQAPTKNGYTFLGWFGDAEFTPAPITEIVKGGTADIALFASWEINEYTLTFVTNGGGDVEPITQNFNTAITLPTLTKTGHTFAGWYTDEGLTTAFTSTTMPANSTTLYAQWTINQYTITFDTRGGNDIAPITQDYGTTVTAPDDPIKGGARFINWAVDTSWDSEKYTFSTMPAENITIYARWSHYSYEITYYTDGGINHIANPNSYTVQNAVTLQDPTKLDYTFLGWYDNQEFAGDAITEISNGIFGTLSLYAKWDAVVYNITYNLNGGTNHADNPTTYTVESNAIILQTPTQDGFYFHGWYDNADFNGGVITEINIASGGNVVLFANWSVSQYKISFEENGGSKVLDIEGNVGAAITAPDEPTKTGYDFLGWFTEAEQANAYVFSTMPEDNLTLYAKWEATVYDIIYKLDDGTTNHADNPATYTIESDTITLNAPTKTGYTFLGWFDNSTFEGERIYNIDGGTTGDVNLYAKWEATVYDITYELNDGTNHADNPAKYTIESDTIILNAPTKTGHTFFGWYLNIDGEVPLLVTSIKQGSYDDKTLLATWTVNQYTISFDTKGGDTIEPIKQDYGSAVSTIIPTRNGANFTNWYSDDKFVNIYTFSTMPNADITLYAQWTLIEYKIKFGSDGHTSVPRRPLPPESYNIESTVELPVGQIEASGPLPPVFVGWQILRLSNLNIYTQITPEMGITGDIDFYGVCMSPAFEYTYNQESNSFAVTKRLGATDKAIIPRVLPVPGKDGVYAPVTVMASTLSDTNTFDPLGIIELPNTITLIEKDSLLSIQTDDNMLNIRYKGTLEEWGKVTRIRFWNKSNLVVLCSNGTFDALYGEENLPAV